MAVELHIARSRFKRLRHLRDNIWHEAALGVFGIYAAMIQSNTIIAGAV